MRAAKAETSASKSEGDAERDRALAEMRAVQSEIGVKTTELSALREKLAYAEAMREEAAREGENVIDPSSARGSASRLKYGESMQQITTSSVPTVERQRSTMQYSGRQVGHHVH